MLLRQRVATRKGAVRGVPGGVTTFTLPVSCRMSAIVKVVRSIHEPKSGIWNRKGAKDTKENKKIAMRMTFTPRGEYLPIEARH
jgi:hypothetical protein